MHVDNFRVVTVTYSQFSDRVFDKLGIRVAYNQSWYYKMTDYKPTMAHLFPEIVNERKYAFWGEHASCFTSSRAVRADALYAANYTIYSHEQ
jgi:hypothetical protein